MSYIGNEDRRYIAVRLQPIPQRHGGKPPRSRETSRVISYHNRSKDAQYPYKKKNGNQKQEIRLRRLIVNDYICIYPLLSQVGHGIDLQSNCFKALMAKTIDKKECPILNLTAEQFRSGIDEMYMIKRIRESSEPPVKTPSDAPNDSGKELSKDRKRKFRHDDLDHE